MRHIDICDVTPITFLIDFTSRYSIETAIEKVYNVFNMIDRHRAESLSEINQQLSLLQGKGQKKPIHLKETMFDGHNVWILKPNNCNRGRGLFIVNRIEDLV